jgi:hypothetical protein
VQDSGCFSLERITEPHVIVVGQLSGGEIVIEIAQLTQQLATAIVIWAVRSYVRAAGHNRERPEYQQSGDEGQPTDDDQYGHPGSSSRSRAMALATARRCLSDS